MLTPPASVPVSGEGTAANPFQLYASLLAQKIDYRLLSGNNLDQVGSVLLFSQAGANTPAVTVASNSTLLSSLTYTVVTSVLNTAGTLLDPLVGLSSSVSQPVVAIRYNLMQRFTPSPRFGQIPQFVPLSYRDDPSHERASHF